MDISCLNPRFHARFHARFPHDPTLNSHEPHMEQAIPISEIPMTSTRLPLIVEPADIGSPGAQPASWKTKDFWGSFLFWRHGDIKRMGNHGVVGNRGLKTMWFALVALFRAKSKTGIVGILHHSPDDARVITLALWHPAIPATGVFTNQSGEKGWDTTSKLYTVRGCVKIEASPACSKFNQP